MKSIPQSNSGPQWNNKLLDDLVFIKKHLRYPFSRRTIPSTLIIAAFMYWLGRMMWVIFLVQQRKPAITFLVISLMIVILFTGIYNYYRTLKFAIIPTPFPAAENRRLVEKFLQSQQLATYTHPKAPEVFQIASKPLGNSISEQREIMIFIADDNRILINSHFINQKFALTPSSRNYRQMANRLKEWVTIHYPAAVMVRPS